MPDVVVCDCCNDGVVLHFEEHERERVIELLRHGWVPSTEQEAQK